MKSNHVILASVAMFFVYGCVPGSIHAVGKSSKGKGLKAIELMTEKEAKIQKKWQVRFIRLFQDEYPKASVAWALFSYSGWADNGQILLFGEKNKGTVAYAGPAKKEITTSEVLAKEKYQKFIAAESEFVGLEDLQNNVVDGLQFEYIKLQKTPPTGEIRIVNRVFMNNPGVGNKASAAHNNLVNSFTEIKEAIVPEKK